MIELLSDEIEANNKKIISDIVGKTFSLRKDSLEKFNKLLENREIAKEFDFIDKKSLRFIKEVEVANETDKSFNIFNGFFGSLDISYKDFSDNHITIGKNKMKIQKYIFKRLSEEPDKFMVFFNHFVRSDLYLPSFCNVVIGDKLYSETGEHQNPIENIDFENIRKIAYSKDEPDNVCFKFRKKGTENIIINLITPKDKMFNYINKEILRAIITRIYEKIGESKAPTRKLHLVVSLNFADWFLCSTEEKWTSCLNLDSDYECCYWKGLPGLIEDKNRCMVYLTDGTRKNFHGIETYHIIARTWCLLTKVNNEIKLWAIRGYPNAFNFRSFIDELGFVKTISENDLNNALENGAEVEFPYDFEGIFMDIGEDDRWWTLTIYGDGYGLRYNQETKRFNWDFNSSGAVSWFIHKDGKVDDIERVYTSYENGVSTLLEENDEIKNYWG